jgi:uncharacterized protein (TIGR02466 family)
MEILPIFPTLIFKTNIPIPDGMDKWCEKYSTVNKSVQFSNRGGYHSPMNILDNKEFRDKFFTPFITTLSEESILPTFRTNAVWFIVNRQGNYNHPHRHPNCDYTFVWYVKCSDNTSPITFENPQQFSRFNHFVMMNQQLREDYNYAGTYYWNPIPGDVLMFPSDLSHYVEASFSRETRIVVSGNIVFEQENK